VHPILERLKQRKIAQWALAYLAGAWVLYQILDAFGDPWGVSDGFLRLVQLGLIVGFFLALTLAWYHGERGEQRVTGVELLILAGIMGLGGIGLTLVRGPEQVDVGGVGGVVTWVSGGYNQSSYEVGPRDRGFVYAADGTLWYRPWDRLDGQRIAGTDGVGGAWWMSSDGHLVAFSRAQKVWVVEIPNGSPEELAAAADHLVVGVTDSGLVYVQRDGRILGAAQGGDDLRAITTLRDGEIGHARPSELDGGRALLFQSATQTGWFIEGLDLSTGARTRIVSGSLATYLQPGFLIYLSPDGRLLAGRFDPRELRLTGESMEIASGVRYYDLSPDGDLMFTEGASSERWELVWLDRAGHAEPADSGWVFDPGGANAGWRLSPDDRRVALRLAGAEGHDIWVRDLEAGTMDRLTFHPTSDRMPRWGPDGSTVTFLSDRLGNHDLWEVAASGLGEPTHLVGLDANLVQGFYTPDGTEIILRTTGGSFRQGAADILVQPAEGEAIVRGLVDSELYDEATPALSPDGRFLAYTSTRTGQLEVYLRPYPDVDAARWRVSADGGASPVWSASGQELYFNSWRPGSEDFMTVARIEPNQANPVAGLDTLFSFTGYMSNTYRDFYDVAADGRILAARRAGQSEAQGRQILIQKLDSYLEDRVPR
jgi:eukaryotic-like serine/threonine-protein kinase